MSKLIGTSPNQVPSNADLGTAAFVDVQEFLSTEGSQLSAINSTIPKTAVDVLIYDTRKDSDGGAWRKRCQHLSWYNERLNTQTRGSRREFPAVAVIVAEEDTVTIYDADDSNLPMWMVFNSSAAWNQTLLLTNVNLPLTSVAMINGLLAVGTFYNSQGLVLIDFLQDSSRAHLTTHQYGGYDDTPLSERNNPGHDFASGAYGNLYTANIVSNAIYDVAMTVLDNAPVDYNTGLPIPTIAVGTYEGVSVIKDDGIVVNFRTENNAGYNDKRAFKKVDFDRDGRLLYNSSQHGRVSGNYQNMVMTMDSVDKYTSFTTDYSLAPRSVALTWDGLVAITPNLEGIGSNTSRWAKSDYSRQIINPYSAGDMVAVQSPDHLTLIDYVTKTYNPLVANITSEYNTGWMEADTKLATFVGNDDTPQTNKELITNGTFDINTAGWTAQSGASITHSSGTAIATSNGVNAWNGVYQGISGLEVGKKYILTADIITSNNWGSINFTAGAGSALKFGAYTSWNGGSSFPLKARCEWVATQSNIVVAVDSLNTTSATVTQFDNVTMRLAEEDRSVTNKGLIVRGMLKKVPVEPGADLLAYTGFSNGNPGSARLEQPYNSELAFGTGDFSIKLWLKDLNTGEDIIGLGKRGVDLAWNLYHDSAGGLRFHTSTNGTGYEQPVEHQFGGAINSWTQVCVFRRGGVFYMAINGKVTQTNSNLIPYDINATTGVLLVGSGTTNNTTNSDAKISMLRIAKGSAPSDEQIKKMYDDEKALFRPNAKATLYGTSNSISAIAYDEDNDIVHVGTTSGRSEFKKLLRVNNTTEAVGVSMSASNGMIVEE